MAKQYSSAVKKLRGKRRKFRNKEQYIPEGVYCYTRNEKGEVQVCPFYRIDRRQHPQENGVCLAFNMRDTDHAGLLFDMVKECGVKPSREMR